MTSPSARIAAAKIAGLITLLVVVATAPIWWIAPFPLIVLLGIASGAMQWRRFLRRLLPILLIAMVMACGAAWSHVGRTEMLAARSAVRALIAGSLLIAFAETTSLGDVFAGMKALRMPALLTSSLALMLRSIDVLGEERKALLRSRAARGGERRSWWAEWRGRAGLVGLLLMRAVDRSERVHRAMKARGWSAATERR